MSAAVLVFKLFDEGAAFYTLHMVSVEEYAPLAAFSLAFKTDNPPSWERSPSLEIGLRGFKSRMQSRMAAWSKCQLGSCASSGRAWQPWAARYSQKEPAHWALRHCLGCTS